MVLSIDVEVSCSRQGSKSWEETFYHCNRRINSGALHIDLIPVLPVGNSHFTF